MLTIFKLENCKIMTWKTKMLINLDLKTKMLTIFKLENCKMLTWKTKMLINFDLDNPNNWPLTHFLTNVDLKKIDKSKKKLPL